MQIFIKLLNGKYQTLDVNKDDTILDLMTLIEKKGNISPPRQRLIFCGKQLEAKQTLQKIEKESTIHLCGRMAQQIYVKWQGKWLGSKEYPDIFNNFWNDLTKKNLIRVDYSENHRYTSTVENLTVYHLKKIVAKFLLLEPSEITLRYYRKSDIVLEDKMLLENSWGHVGCDFIAELKISKN